MFFLLTFVFAASGLAYEKPYYTLDGKRYDKTEYQALKATEIEKIKARAEEIIAAFQMQDMNIGEWMIYEGSPLDRDRIITSVIQYYSTQGRHTFVDAEVIGVKMDEDLKRAEATVKTNWSAMDMMGGYSTAPVMEKWIFVYEKRNSEWYLSISQRRGPYGFTVSAV
ncbi:MAG: hypothetical protein JW893_01560 [Candidatus Omnitrophica bacterium]|nr:hypothetical protein [Candidatus Omnitrophota bacterium]